MYKKVLIAYDGSSFSGGALEQGAALARLCGAELHLVGIVVTPPYMVPDSAFGDVDMWGMAHNEIGAALERAVRDLAGQGVTATTSVREGNPAAEIATCATETGADLVVVGHSEKGVFTRWLEGSVGSGLLRDLPCNLLVATSEAR